ncbi:YetF domain-containing protein [Methylobacter svalbardensis]|uniref:YetF domain-containing protein n=1 Tax=Methylobacter svalbardensis TaxID=3080016 RepID=UPI0030EBA8C5
MGGDARNGKLLHRKIRQGMITEDELMSKIREQSLEDLTQVKDVYMEGNGTISVIKRE